MAARMREDARHLLPPADLTGELEGLRDSLRNERERHLRTVADFTNYRRRIERDGNKLAEEGKRALLLPLLEIIDDMENAIRSANNEKQHLAQGLQIIHRKLLALLKVHGVLPFDSVGMVFNPDEHDAVAMVEREDIEPGTIVDELRRGYRWNNELLRPAQVRVAG